MSLVYFEDRDGLSIVILASKIAAIRANRLPSDTPTSIVLDGGGNFNVRGSPDIAQQKLAAALKGQP